MILRGLSNRQSESYGGGRYKPSKREAKVINLTASTTQKLQMPLCANLHLILCPILVVSLSYSTCKSYKISYTETRRRFRYRADELGGHEAVSLVRVILAEGLGRSRGTPDGRLHSHWWLGSGPLRPTRCQPTGFAGRTTEGNRHGPYRWPFFVLS